MPNDTMRAAALDQFGGPDQLAVHTLPVPDVGSGELLIRVHTAGVGVWDPFEREGQMVEMMEGEPRFPYVLGSDGAGTVAAVGADVQGFQEGDEVYAVSFLNPKGGFYAEYAVTEADYAAPVPRDLDQEQAGALGVDAVTALRGLRDTLGLQEGEALLVYGASGGVGHLAVQLAKRMGARVLAVASGADGVALAEALDADAAVDGKTGDVAEAARQFAPDGLDAALVTAGGGSVEEALTSVRSGGRIAWPNGVMPEPQPPEGVEGSAYDGEPGRELLDRLNELIEAGPFRVHVARTFGLDEAAEAHRALDEHFLGKLALTVGE